MSNITLDSIGETIRRQIESDHPRLLSEINLSDEELGVLRSSADVLVVHALVGRYAYDIQVAYLMMDVGMRNYHDGTYWDDFWREATLENDVNDQTTLGKYFLEVLRKYNMAIYSGGNRRYVNNIMMHAFIPENQQYRDGFFNFILKFYQIVLKSSVPDELGSHMQAIADVFSRDTVDDYPEFKNLPLIQSTKIALSDVSRFGHTVEKIIHRLAGDYDSAGDISLGRYEKSYRAWSSCRSSPKYKHKGINEKPFMYYDFQTSGFFINLPSMEIKNPSANEVRVESMDGQVLYKSTLYFSIQFGRVITDEKSISVEWNPLDEFKIYIGGRESYNNKNPGFILLNKRGIVKRKVSLGFNMIVKPQNLETNIHSSVICDFESCSLEGFMIKRGETLEVGGYRFVVEEELSPNLHIISPCLDIGCRDQDGNKFDLYSAHPKIKVSIVETRGKFKLSISRGIDSIIYDSLKQLIEDPKSESSETEIMLDISHTSLRCDAGIYRVRLNGREVYSYVLVPGFEYVFEKEFYENDENSTITYTGSSFPKQFNTSQGIVETGPMQVDGHEFSMKVQVPSRRFSFDMKQWYMFGTELYFRETQYSELYIYCPTLVYPEIRVNIENSKPVNLEVEGQMLRCNFSKIAQISSIIENSKKNISRLEFKCGRFSLFAIRYNADYQISKDLIVRSNAPMNTWSVCKEVPDGIEYEFVEDKIEIPKSMNNFEIIEYYGDDFGSECRVVASVSRSICIPVDIKGRIIAGDEFPRIFDKINSISLPGKDFKNLVEIEKPYSPEKQKQIRELYLDNTMRVKSYDNAVDAVKKTILSDSNINRIKKRINRFREHDVIMTYRLCESYLKLVDDEMIRQLKDNLEPEYIRVLKLENDE